MMIVLTPEEIRIAHEKQRELYAEALADTIRLYPNTDPMALVTFQIKLGCGFGLVTQDDIDWARGCLAAQDH